MKNLWSEILVPAVIAGLTVIGTVGVETTRTVRPDARVRLLREVRLDTLTKDTLQRDTVKPAVPKKETVVKDLSDDDFDFFDRGERPDVRSGARGVSRRARSFRQPVEPARRRSRRRAAARTGSWS